MTTITEESIKVLKKSRKEVLRKELVKKVSIRTGYSEKSVSGTLIGYSKGRLLSDDYFRKNWAYLNNPLRFIRKSNLDPQVGNNLFDIDYDCKKKQKVRKESFSVYFSNYKKSNPKILTLAGSEGYCVKDFLKKRPKCDIINLERNEDILNIFKTKGMKTLNKLDTVENFISKDKLDFDLINLDFTGYGSLSKHETFCEINKKSSAKIIIITLQYTKNPSNHGKFVEYIYSKYRRYDDKLLRWMKDCFSNYNLEKTIKYKRDNTKANSRTMRVCVFKR